MSDDEINERLVIVDEIIKGIELPTIEELLTDIDNLKQRIEVD